jgi:L,D-transpeptidase ErfK/SrfK
MARMHRMSQLMAVVMVGAANLHGERRLIINIPDRKLALVVDGEVKKVYPVAVGSPDTPSPIGSFTIITRIKNPTWYGPRKVVAPGPQNPLGPRWIGLSQKGYGVHGTSAPKSIGKAASHGCIRMRNRDVEELFELVQTGDPVELVGETNEATTAVLAGGVE